ncbi:MAG: hypothetical protein ABIJ59_07605 [Pseudomonadota bacterium]
MKQTKNQNQICDHCLTGIMGIMWVAGLIIAGSDSLYMPWLNIIGLVLFLGASLMMGKRLNPAKKCTGTLIQPDFFRKQPYMIKSVQNKNKQSHTRYALSA